MVAMFMLGLPYKVSVEFLLPWYCLLKVLVRISNSQKAIQSVNAGFEGL